MASITLDLRMSTVLEPGLLSIKTLGVCSQILTPVRLSYQNT